MTEIIFEYHPEIVEAFPAIRAGVLLGSEMRNGPTPPALQQLFIEEQQRVRAEIGDTPLSELATLAAWRGAFRQFGVNPTKYRSAIEALLRRLTKKGDIPSINMLVDIGNLVSIRYRIPVAVFDLAQVTGPIRVKFADGSERFRPLFQTEVEHPTAGEVAFCDQTGMVVARRWCWRQSDESAARPETQRAVIVTEAHHAQAEQDVAAGRDDMLAFLQEYVGGEFISDLLGPERGRFP